MNSRTVVAGKAAFSCQSIAKGFGGIPVLKAVNLDLLPGEVVALVGENGAGKSTLLKIIAGQVRPDEGSLTLSGELLGKYTPTVAHSSGVSIIPQELAPVPDMTVYENIFLGRELRDRFGMVNRRAERAEARKLLDSFDLDIDPSEPMRHLTVAFQQIVEIIKATFAGSRVLLLDEPTSAISNREVARLYRTIDRLREEGVAIVYTTHKMEEIRATADRVVVLRDGRLIVDARADVITDDEIVSAMIGRDLADLFPVKGVAPDGSSDGLTLDRVRVNGFDGEIDLAVKPGEIVALAGLVGAGRTELLEAVFGERRRKGTVTVGGQVLREHRPSQSISAGVGFVPEDRKNAGLVMTMSILDNGILPHLRRFSSGGWLRRSGAVRAVGDVMDSMQLRRSSLLQSVSTLSGGNQQKVVLGRWLTQKTQVMLLDEPTRGVDIGARSEMYRLISDLAKSGVAVLMASSDMAEVIGLAHRVIVIRGGQIVGEIAADELDASAQERIFRLASGLETGGTK